MLVTFTSNVAGELMMFAEVAQRLLQLVGKECTARGVITAEQIPDIIARLRQAMVEDKAQQGRQGGADDDEAANVVSLGRRAQPFIEFLELTVRDDGFVLWEAPRDFR